MKVSIITPSFNQGSYLGATIESILMQGASLGDFVIIDGGSSDDTSDVLTAYMTESKIKTIISEPDQGQTHALSKGVMLVSDEIMGYLNSDDLLEHGSLDYVVDYFSNNSEVDVLCGGRKIIGPKGKTVRYCKPIILDDHEFYRSMLFFQESTFWRREAFERAGGFFNLAYNFAMDFELLCRMRATGSRFATTDRTLGCFRVHNASKTSLIYWQVGMVELRKIWSTYGLEDMTQEQLSSWTKRLLRRYMGSEYWPSRLRAWIGNRLVRFY